MKNRSLFLLLISHLCIGGLGFALGIYYLPILIAPDGPDDQAIAEVMNKKLYFGEFSLDRKDSDRLHWGEGTVSISQESIAFSGELAPGPDYRLYLSPQFVETEDEFNRLKVDMLHVGYVKTFESFLVSLPLGIDLSKYNTVIVWCETFGQFITSTRYKRRS